jgi:phage gpG-like protein
MIEIEGLGELRARIAAMKAATEHLEPALLRAGISVLRAAQDRIDAGGPGWPPNKTGTPLLHRTGRLLGSLTVGAAANISRLVDGNEIIVGTNVRYARWLQDGTKAHGRGSPLAQRHGPRARASGGIPARKFLVIDSQGERVISKIFADHIMGASAPGA